MNSDHSPDLIIARMKLAAKKQQEHLRQLRLEKEIEEQGIIYGWKSVGLTQKTAMSKLKQLIIVRYKTAKVAKFILGNVLLCEKDGCFTYVEMNQSLCKFHIKNEIKYFYCMSEEICTTRATYGYEEKKPLTCKKHIRKEAFDVTGKKCEEPGCKKQATFGSEGRATSCLEHKDDKMYDTKHHRCVHPECDLRASFGEIGGIPSYCSEHNDSKYKNIVYKKCKDPGCETGASFGHKGCKVECCFIHKENGMSNLYSKKCIINGCETCAVFGEINGKPTHCDKHQEKNMINLRSKRCIIDGCDTVPIFGVINGKNTHCLEHKDELMVDNRNKKCEFENCEVRAGYGFSGMKSSRCKEHILDNMIEFNNIKKLCITAGCQIRSSYGYLYSDKNNHCYDHSNLNEYNEPKRHPKCSKLMCSHDAKYIDVNDQFMQPINCLDHKQLTDIELIEKTCKKCSIIIYIPENKDLCAACGDYRYKIFRIKEEEIKQFLLVNNFEFIHNKPVNNRCSSFRPDFLIDCKFGKIIIECDEFQHSSYDKNDEERRMITIYKDIQFIKPSSEVIFIRYNPDNTKDLKFDVATKLTSLYNTLLYLMNLNQLNIPLGVIYLYYTGFNSEAELPIQNIKM